MSTAYICTIFGKHVKVRPAQLTISQTKLPEGYSAYLVSNGTAHEVSLDRSGLLAPSPADSILKRIEVEEKYHAWKMDLLRQAAVKAEADHPVVPVS